MLMKRICAWCGSTQGFKEVTDFRWRGKEPVTHTICPECQRKIDEIQSVNLQTHNNHQSEKTRRRIIMIQTATLENVIDQVHQISANHYDEIVPVQEMEFDSLNQMWVAGKWKWLPVPSGFCPIVCGCPFPICPAVLRICRPKTSITGSSRSVSIGIRSFAGSMAPGCEPCSPSGTGPWTTWRSFRS